MLPYVPLLTWWHRHCCALTTDARGRSGRAERLASILGGHARTEELRAAASSSTAALVALAAQEGGKEEEVGAAEAMAMAIAPAAPGTEDGGKSGVNTGQHDTTAAPSDPPPAPRADALSPSQQQQQQQQHTATRRRRRINPFMSKTEKQLRTVLFRLVHKLDLLNFEGTPHDVPSVHNIFVNPRTGALSMRSVGSRFDAARLVARGHPRAGWAPEICLQWLEEKQLQQQRQQQQQQQQQAPQQQAQEDHPVSIPLAKADTWAVGVLVCDLLGVELPWHDELTHAPGTASSSPSSSLPFLPDYIVRWGINHIDDSLGSLSMHDELRAALSPSLSNFVLECLWVAAARRPSIREIKLHPFFANASVARTVRGKWVQPPVMRVFQYRNKLGGDKPITKQSMVPGHAMEEAKRELDFLTGSGSRHEFSCASLSRRVIGASADNMTKEMANISATDCDGDNARDDGTEDNLRLLPTIFTMPMTCCGTAYANNGSVVSSVSSEAALFDDSLSNASLAKRVPSSIHRVVSLQQNASAVVLRKDISVAVARNARDLKSTSKKTLTNGGDKASATARSDLTTQSINKEASKNNNNSSNSTNNNNDDDDENTNSKKDGNSAGVKFARVFDALSTPNALSPLSTKRLDPKSKRLLAQIIISEGSPPQLRGSIWSLLLSISPCIAKWQYAGCTRRAQRVATNKSKMHSQKETKAAIQLLRQMAKDIPRCHAYHARLKSKPYPEALRNVLLAWTLAERPRMYWQGLDSICAPLLLLHKSNEALTFASLEGLISTFLSDIFVLNNHLALQERLLGLQHIVSFLDPQLSNHLRDIGVTPNLYAISWFLTLFAHVLPIDLVLEVWDVFLGLAHVSSPPGKEARCACGLPVLFAAVLLSRLRSYIFPEDFAGTTVFLSRLPCPLTKIVRDVLHSLPLVFRLVPRSVLRLNDPLRSRGIDSGRGEGTEQEEEPTGMSSRAQFVEDTKYERSPRIQPCEVLAGPMFDKSLIVDVRSEKAFASEHVLGSVNIPLTTDRGHACRTVMAQRVQLGSLFVIVLGEDIESAAIFSGALVDQEVTMVMTVGTSAKAMFEQADSSILVRSKRSSSMSKTTE